MSHEKHVREELVAYLDGEIPAVNQTRIEAHLAVCADCRAALEELRLLQAGIGDTLDRGLSPIRLSYSADERIHRAIQTHLERPVWWQHLWARRGYLMQAAMAVFVVLISVTMLRVRTRFVDVPVYETVVLNQDRFAPGSQGALRVVVQSLGSALPAALPVPGADVVVNLVRSSSSQTLFEGKTDATGSANITFTMPEDYEGEAALIVETTTNAGSERIVRPIHIERTHKIYLGSDKPTYRPGQPIHLRALVLDAVSGLPPAGEILTFQLIDAQSNVIYRNSVALTSYGVGFTQVQLTSRSPLGVYTIQASVGDMVVDRQIEVKEYPLPAFRVSLGTTESFISPGERLHGVVTSTYFFGKSVPGTVRMTFLNSEGVLLEDQTGLLDADGRYQFTLELPKSLHGDAITILASVRDTAGQIEGIKHVVPVNATPILIRAVPESGRLKAGVENIIYLATLYPDGSPAQTDLLLEVQGQQTHLQTDAFGLSIFKFTPTGSTDILLTARDAEGRTAEETIHLTADTVAKSLLLHADRAAYAVGETMMLEALVGAPDVTMVYLDVIRNGQTTAVLSNPVADGTAVFALDLDITLRGALTLRAYALQEGRVIVEDTRLVVVDPAGSLDITVSSDKDTYKPGEMAHLDVTTALQDREGIQTPVQSALGIAVVDTSVLSLDMLPPGFARTYFLMDSALLTPREGIPGFDPPSLLEGAETARQAQDIAARATWAGLLDVLYSAPSSVRIEGIDQGALRRTQLSRSLAWLLTVLPVILGVVVIRGLIPSGVFWRACRRLVWGLLALTVLSPVLIAGIFLGGLLPWLGATLALGLLLVAVVLLAGLFILSWAHHDIRMQLTGALVTAYLIASIFAIFMAPDTAVPSGGWVVIIAGVFILLLISLFVLAQGLLLEDRQLDGWIVILLMLVLMLLAVSLPVVPQLQSNLSQTLSNPMLYSGPIGWLSGCAMYSAETPQATEVPATEKEIEATSMPALPTPSPAPTGLPPGTATPVTVPRESYPLRQIFPETLYWAPDIETDVGGTFGLDIQMADSLTTWRLTALGSTLTGEIGAASYDLQVFQDFFVEVTLPESIAVDESTSVTLTLYNYLEISQSVSFELGPSTDYLIEKAPSTLIVGAQSVASTQFTIVPQRSGKIILDVKAVGDSMVDALQLELDVTGP